MRLAATGDYVFTLRQPWISLKIGLPGEGLALDGFLRVEQGSARVSVFTSLVPVVFFGGLWTAGALIALSIVATAPTLWDTLGLACWLWFGYYTYRNSRRAVKILADDAVASLQRAPRSGPDKGIP